MEANKALKEAIRKLEYADGDYLNDEEVAEAIKFYQPLVDSLFIAGAHYRPVATFANGRLQNLLDWQCARKSR